MAEEATTDHCEPSFFAEHSLEDLREHTDYWLGHQGRLVHPMVRRRDGTHYEPISWDEAFELIGETLRGLEHPDQAIFYTSGKTSNEAAYTYQLFARAFGTNNLPGLLQHVPRVDLDRPGRGDRDRQGDRATCRTCTTPT